MNISRKTKQIIIVGIAAVLIIYGLLESVFDFNIDPGLVNNVGMVLMIVAFGMLFSRGNDRKKSNHGDGTSGDGADTNGAGTGEDGTLPSAMENDVSVEDGAGEGIDDGIDTHNEEAGRSDNP